MSISIRMKITEKKSGIFSLKSVSAKKQMGKKYENFVYMCNCWAGFVCQKLVVCRVCVFFKKNGGMLYQFLVHDRSPKEKLFFANSLPQ